MNKIYHLCPFDILYQKVILEGTKDFDRKSWILYTLHHKTGTPYRDIRRIKAKPYIKHAVGQHDSHTGQEDSHIPVQQNGTISYTDGSKTEQSTGAGATNRDPGCEISMNLGNFATVFQAEITAVSACAQEMTRRSYINKRIQIISDSQAALKALGAVEIHSQVVKDCMDPLTKLAEHNSITLKWMRGHQGHVGNERADFLAKKGAEVPLIGPEPTCGLAYRTARRVMKDLLREKHILHWAKVPGLRHSRMFIGQKTS
ncbi:hypothetical protein NQ318_017833 [Aromia moschata]|uniref:ribonuclease H n=1 Tax=Aromia moschata TaxID=1265417 RepID=A0AAV8YGP2_9CUCU|nr:hypothetical protein NQ318_017833 [Aromia moschata]